MGLSREHIDIDELIKLEQNQKRRKILSNFKKDFDQTDRITVTEKSDHYEIIVSHPSTSSETGGAEQYFLDKKTGKHRMGWHEHPQRMEVEIELKSQE